MTTEKQIEQYKLAIEIETRKSNGENIEGKFEIVREEPTGKVYAFYQGSDAFYIINQGSEIRIKPQPKPIDALTLHNPAEAL